jgi:hemerythrin-like domain-containing protein
VPVPNAIEMLRDDHRKVKQLFDEFEHAEESQAKEQIRYASWRCTQR